MSNTAVKVLKKFGVHQPSDGLIREIDRYIEKNGTLVNDGDIYNIIGKVSRVQFKNRLKRR